MFRVKGGVNGILWLWWDASTGRGGATRTGWWHSKHPPEAGVNGSSHLRNYTCCTLVFWIFPTLLSNGADLTPWMACRLNNLLFRYLLCISLYSNILCMKIIFYVTIIYSTYTIMQRKKIKSNFNCIQILRVMSLEVEIIFKELKKMNFIPINFWTLWLTVL